MSTRSLLVAAVATLALGTLVLGACPTKKTVYIIVGDASLDGTVVTDAGGDAAAGDGSVSDGAVADGTTTPDAQVDTGPDTVTPPPVGCDNIVTVLDSEPLSVVNGFSQELSVFIPENTVSVAISVVGELSDAHQYALGSWLNPAGTLIGSNWELDGQNGGGALCFTCGVRIAASQGAFTAMAPNNPNATFEAGEHRFTVTAKIPPDNPFGGGAPTPVDDDVFITVQAKVIEGGLPETGTLNLNLYFTGAQGWTASSVQNNADFTTMMDRVKEIYTQVGVSLGNVTYSDIPAEFQVIESLDGPDADLMRMFAESEGSDPQNLNVFFVDELSGGPFGGFGVILGIAGGIPGPPLLPGTPRSGVAIAIKPVPNVPAEKDTTMAHEMGHFLGLFHTAEQSFGGFIPAVYDPLPDTPETDDTSWLMHNTGSGDQMSTWQGIVMRSNPWMCH